MNDIDVNTKNSDINSAEDINSTSSRGWAKLVRNKAALIGGVFLLVFIFCAIFAPVLFNGNPSAPDLFNSLTPPSADYILGTDQLGRSIAGRILYGARVSLMLALGVVGFGFLFPAIMAERLILLSNGLLI